MGRVSFHSGKKSVQIHGIEYAYAWGLVDRIYPAMDDINQIDKKDDGNAALNTMIVMGSPPIQFLACFAGLGDPWFWIKGEDRVWLASIIEDGLKIGILRWGVNDDNSPKSLGWEELIALLREDSVLPVVTTYSTNFGSITSTIQKGDPKKIARFLADLEQSENGKWRRIGPDNLNIPRFKGHRHMFDQNRKLDPQPVVV